METIPLEDKELIKIRKEKVLNYFKKNTDWLACAFLALIAFIAIRIRIVNLSGLKDITTGDWTLGPDLDPFLFLRWAKHIIENGSLMVVDSMRYVPLGFKTTGEYLLHPYMVAWFHNVA